MAHAGANGVATGPQAGSWLARLLGVTAWLRARRGGHVRRGSWRVPGRSPLRRARWVRGTSPTRDGTNGRPETGLTRRPA
ncbi:hypothetical protein QJS66_01340 [Kocuria rhizophila]|nr:hypothetical protein QJS66_01340 [Kocuria rhizophila]